MTYDIVRIDHTGTHEFLGARPEVSVWLQTLKSTSFEWNPVSGNPGTDSFIHLAEERGWSVEPALP